MKEDKQNQPALTPDSLGITLQNNFKHNPNFTRDGKKIKAVLGDEEMIEAPTRDDRITAFAWSPDGKFLCTATGIDLKIWDVLNANEIASFPSKNRSLESITSVSWSPNGKKIAYAFEKLVWVLDISNGDQIEMVGRPSIFERYKTFGRESWIIEQNNSRFLDVDWSLDGDVVTSILHHGQVNPQILELRDSEIISDDLNPEGVYFWQASDGGLLHFQSAPRFLTERLLLELDQGSGTISWQPKGEHVAFISGNFFNLLGENYQLPIVDLPVGEFFLLDKNPDESRFSTRTLAWSRLGNLLAYTTEDARVCIFDMRTGSVKRTLEGFTETITSLSFSSDDGLLMISSFGNIQFWSCESWNKIGSFYTHEFSASKVAFNPHQPLFAAFDHKGGVNVWEVQYDVMLGVGPIVNTTHYTNSKVVLVGESGTGKTCLARALMDYPFEAQQSTHGMKTWIFHSEKVDSEDGEQITREVLLWDFAGQVDYQVIHQLFLDQTVLGLVVFDPTHPENPFRGVSHWEKALSGVAGENCAKLLVAGRIDRGHPTATEADITTFSKQHGFKRFVATSANTGKGVDTLRAAILETIPWDRLPVTSSPRLWSLIRNFLLRRRKSPHVLSTRKALMRAFRAEHKGETFTTAEFDTVLRQTQTHGLVWILSFGDYVLMKPELLNNYAAAVVRAARKHPEGLGCIEEKEILDASFDFEDMKRLSPATERKLLYAVIELMLRRELALRGGLRNEFLIFPSKFNRKLPETPELPHRVIAYRFEGKVENIYTSLVVRLAYSEAFRLRENGLWKNAAGFLDVRGRLCGFQIDIAKEGTGILSAFFDVETSIDGQVLFLRFVNEHLIQWALPNSVNRQRLYRCVHCDHEVKDAEAINYRLKKGLDFIPCLYCEEKINLIDELEEESGNPELFGKVRKMEQEALIRKHEEIGVTVAEAKASIGEFDIFLAHHDTDKSQVEFLAQSLRERGLTPWLDKEQIPPGRWWQDVIQKAIPKVKSAAIFVGSQAFKPLEIVELRSFVSQCLDRKIPVIPVLLPGIKEIPEDLAFMKGFVTVKFQNQIEEPEALDQFVWGITGKNPRRRN